MVAALEQRGDAQEHGVGHAEQGHDDLADQAGVAVRGLLEDDNVAGDALETLR